MKTYHYPERLEIRPVTKPVNATVRVPGSKSITNRALVLAALGSRRRSCTLTGALRSDDTEIMIAALGQLGFRVAADWESSAVHVVPHGCEECIPASAADLFLGNSGTSMRFLTAACGLGRGEYRLDGDARMRQRPIQGLLNALNQAGISAVSERYDGCPPVRVQPSRKPRGKVRVEGSVSSQFLSAMKLIEPFAPGLRVLQSDDLVSEPYLNMTVDLISQWGDLPDGGLGEYAIEPDATAASYFFASSAVTSGHAKLIGLPKGSIQGDVQFALILAELGCSLDVDRQGFSVRGGRLRGITADMNAISDTVMTLAAVACFAEGPTTIRNVAHIRHKECDRISALCTELRKLGVEVEEYPDGLKITPRPMRGAEIETYNDHRMAMSMALIGLKVPGVVIKNPGCVAKTYPGYWEDFERLYGDDR